MRVFFISGPKKNVVNGYWLYDKLKEDFQNVFPFYIRKDNADSSMKRLFNQLKIIFIVLFKAKSDDKIIVYDNDTTGLYIALALSFFRPHLIVYKINAMANSSSKLYSPLKRFFVRRAYKRIFTTVNNQDIADLYSKFLNLPMAHFIPIPDSISDFGKDIETLKDTKEQGYIFMGGATHRDYALFVDVARSLPQYQFVAVTFEQYKSSFKDAPSNVQVYYGLSEMDFYQKIANCNIVFIPLNNDMQGGQLVVMQGALLHKPIITTETVAVHTYFDRNTAYLMPIGDKAGSINIIQELMGNSILRKAMGDKAYRQIAKFTVDSIYEQYKKKLFVITPDNNGVNK